MRFATGDGDPAKRRPSAILALSFSLLSQLSTMKLYSCKDSDNQHFAYDEFSKKFALDFDYEDDVDQLCMGWDQLEDSSRVIATRCYEDRDPYDAQIYWKIL